MRKTNIAGRILSLAGGFCLAALAAASYAQEAADPAADEAYDEIEVVGKARLDTLRTRLYQSEVDVYDLFNDLNDQNEFDVLCVDHAPTGSHIKERYCEPRFVKELRSEAYRDGRNNRISQSKYRKKQEQFSEIMEQLANDNPALLKALVEYSEAADRYEAEFDQSCVGDVDYCSK